LHKLLIGKQLPIKVRANLGITFNINQKIAVSVLKSGIMIVEGANQEEQAFELYKTVINDLGIS
jgi:TATA-box binding protein (TBP) (component of TFIID and TFIIIB)